jgi:chromosomal replication initiator protein
MEITRTKTPKEIWETALGELQLLVSKPNYRTWFGKTVGLSYRDNQFVIGVPNTFAAEYLEKNQFSLIKKALDGLTSPDVEVIFQVNGKKHGKSTCDTTPLEISSAIPSFTRLNPGYIFEHFIEGDGNRLACTSALTVARNPGHSYNPLFIYGGAGLGKTHLLHAIGHEAAANHINVICTSAEEFTNEFVTALKEKSTEEFRNKYRSIGMLLIDDIHFIGGKGQTEESFFHTFNELHNTNRQIVMTSDCPPRSMPLLEERLRSRFEWGLIVDIQPPDYDTRLAILKSKARQKGISLALEIMDHIAVRTQDNVRLLEGSLNRVTALAKLLQSVPTLEIARQALADISNKEPSVASLVHEAILEAVADSFNLDKEELIGRRRDKDVSLARRLAMYLVRQETNYSLAHIGKILGNRDAATVTTACKRVAAEIQDSSFLKRRVNKIKNSLNI